MPQGSTAHVGRDEGDLAPWDR